MPSFAPSLASDERRHVSIDRRPSPGIGGLVRVHPLLLVSLLTYAVGAQSRGPADLANAPVPPGAQRIAYGSEPLQFGQLRVPSTKPPHPVAVVIHGGCWMSKLGAMDPRAVAMDNMR